MSGSLLVPVDLPDTPTRGGERAALLPLEEGARLTLLHVVPKVCRQMEGSGAQVDAEAAVSVFCKGIEPKLPVNVAQRAVVGVGNPNPVEEIATQAKRADAERVVLIVPPL